MARKRRKRVTKRELELRNIFTQMRKKREAAEKKVAPRKRREAAQRANLLTRFWPWRAAWYKTPNRDKFPCPGHSLYTNSMRSLGNANHADQYAMKVLVSLRSHLLDELADMRWMKLTARMMMTRCFGWSQPWANDCGSLVVTAPSGPRPDAALVLSAHATMAERQSAQPRWTVAYGMACVRRAGPDIYRLVPMEQHGTPWYASTADARYQSEFWTQPMPPHELAQATAWALSRAWNDRAGRKPASVPTATLHTRCPAPFDSDLHPYQAAAIVHYVREYFMNITIPGPA